MTTRCCSFCRNPGHIISTCRDPRIEETWKYVLRQVDIRLGTDIVEDDLCDADTLLRQLPLPFLRVLGVQVGGISVRCRHEWYISAIKAAILTEVENFMYLRWNERIDYLIWMDPDSYDFTAEEEDEEVDLNTAFIADDPRDITHFAFFDRIPTDPSILQELEDEVMIIDEELEKPVKPLIEPLILCLETAFELSALTECSICYDEKTILSFDTTNCGHTFCHECICRHLDSSKNGPTCPSCRTIVETLEVKDIENYDDIIKRYAPPLMIYE